MPNSHTLHIVNGDVTADILLRTPLLQPLPAQMTQGGATVPSALSASMVLPWRDMLHDGPVPHGLSLTDLSEGRARYLAGCGYGGLDEIRNSFVERDALLGRVGHFSEVVLWFEHDLYDQLQLIQLLDWFSTRARPQFKLSLICIDRFDGVTPFYGLGQLNEDQLAGLYPTRVEVTVAQLEVAAQAWRAFTHPDPSALRKLMGQELSALPFLRAALIRLLEEYPDADDGLSRSERQILQLVQAGQDRPGKLFAACQMCEEAPFLGDWPFWQRIDALTCGLAPLLSCEPESFRRPPLVSTEEFKDQALGLTSLGEQVLAAKENWVLRAGIDRWIGGVHLCKAPESH